MEIDRGLTLFERNGRMPILTQSGKELLPYALATISQLNRLNNKATQMGTQPLSQIVIAIDEGVPLNNLSDILIELENKYSMIQVECLSAASKDVIDLVEKGRATTGIIIGEFDLPEQIDYSSAGKVLFDVYVSRQHPLGTNRILHIDELR